MAKQDIVMPQMGESITSGTITKWHKQPGDVVEIDEILLDISTDKVESEIPSPFSGRLEEQLYPEGETIDVGVKIATVEDDPDNVPFEGGSSGGEQKKEVAPTEEKEEKKQEAPTESPAAAKSSETAGGVGRKDSKQRFYTPLVRAMAKEHGVDLSELEQVEGSGAGGRVNKNDFLKFLETRKAGGAKPTAGAQPTAPSSTPAAGAGERVEVVPMDNMRKTIARNMVESKQTSPHVNSIDEIDMTHLVRFREGFKKEFKNQEGFSLTYTHFILYALVQALKDYPRVNSSVDGDNILYKKDINLGCAVAVPGSGLVVPVVKNADNLSVTGIAREVNRLAQKARDKKLTMDELQGGTFTFTNVGSFGTLMATPVILQPQVGIFAAGVIKKRPIITGDDAIAVRHMMYGTHTYDHRIIDGELGGLFLDAVKKHLEGMDPESLF